MKGLRHMGLALSLAGRGAAFQHSGLLGGAVHVCKDALCVRGAFST